MANNSRGIRNCNPLNIRHSSSVWKGKRENQTDKAFVQFKSFSYGVRAGLILIYSTYRVRYGLVTIEQIINRFAPPTENNTKTYITYICTHCNCSPDTLIIDINPFYLLSAMCFLESHYVLTKDTYFEALDLLPDSLFSLLCSKYVH